MSFMLLVYADDINIIGIHHQCIFCIVEGVTSPGFNGQRGQNNDQRSRGSIDNYTFELVNNFVYLSTSAQCTVVCNALVSG